MNEQEKSDGIKRVIPARYNRLMTDPLLREIVSGLDGVAEALAAKQQANVLFDELGTPPPDYAREAAGFIGSGKVDKDWIGRVAKDELAKLVRAEQRKHVSDLINGCLTQLDSIAEYSVDDVLAELDTRLQELVQPLYAAGEKLTGVDTPTDAIRRGLTEEWRLFADAAIEYAKIRAAQKIAVSVAPEEFKDRGQSAACEDPHANSSVIANIAEVWESWNTPPQAELAWSDNDEGDRVARWVRPRVEAPWPVQTDEFLLWCIRNDAELRVPDLGQM
ncbi:hypothetical protein [Nocardia sp. NPDC058705]|uniref:hypothetical protein n=1 Tax=Nocardia sp. NPDC058705 TaxID=3346609 RepID=UPI0036BD1319